MSAHRDSNENPSENKDTNDLSKEPDTPGGLDLQESNLDEETNIRVGVRSVLEPDTSSGLDLQESSVEETKTWVDDGEGDRPDIPPINYLHISKHDAPVNGQFILDLSLPPPPDLGIASDTGRKNLTLHTTNGRVTAEIWIRHNGNTEPERVSLDLCSSGGPVSRVRAIVHDSFSPNGNRRALPFLDMELRSEFGDVYISLPRCFRGPITIRTGDDRIAFSPALGKRTALITDVQGVRVYFVGDRPRGGKWGIGGNDGTVEDLLDEILVDGKHTSVRVNWDGEEEMPFLMPNPWQMITFSADKLFTTGRLF